MTPSWRHLTAAILGLTLLLPTSQALANVAANTQILNQATLTFDDGTGTQTSTAEVAVTVSLVPGLATLSSPDDQDFPYSGADTRIDYDYTITAGGNGPDTYTLATPVIGSSNTTGPSASPSPASMTLGASVTTTGSTATDLQVPADGDDTDSKVNGIANGDTVVVSGEVRTVAGISDPAAGVATITLDSALSAAPGAGVSVFEQQTFTVSVLSGTIDAAGTDVTVTVAATATSGAGGATHQTMSTYTSGTAMLTKFVRNVDDSQANDAGTGGRDFTANGATETYYTGGVAGETGDTLEYLLLAENGSISGAATNCAIDDELPLDFVTFQADAFGTDQDILYVDAVAAEQGLTMESGDDTAEISGSTLTTRVGTGADGTDGGSIGAGETVMVLYRVTIQ